MPNKYLQSLMVINKSKNLNWKSKLKSKILSLVTWFLWGYLISFIINHYDSIFFSPILDSLYFHEIIGIMVLIAFILIIIAIIWSYITVRRRKK
ncbi:hypothetical protein FW755_03915 [Lonepinella koalarum]|nr:hypothetical protein FW755_03915 [Lonepinella koalarum]